MAHRSRRAAGNAAAPAGTAVIYARFSCSKQREASIEDQLRVCQEWCDREGYDVVATYCDRAISGRTDDRPQFQLMVERAGESEVVVVYMMDRFSRDPYDAPVYKRILKEHGTRVVSATEAMPDGPDAILVEKLYEGLAAVESAHISQRTRRGMEGNALKCLHNGVPVFGYDHGEDGRYVINEEQAEVVREIFRRRRGGEPCNAIGVDLARRGWRTSRGNPVGHTWVNNIIKNEKYTGVYLFGDVRVEGGMPQIIDLEEWSMVQGVRGKKVRKHEAWRDYPLAGRAYCGKCGAKLVGYSAYGGSKGRYNYYTCGWRLRHSCDMPSVRAEWLEESIVEAIRDLLDDGERARELAERVRQVVAGQARDGRLEDARRRRSEAESAVKNLLEAVAQGLPYEDVRDDIARYKKQVGATSAEIAMLEHQHEFDVDDFVTFLQMGATLDDRAVLDAFVCYVRLFEDRVVVALNIEPKKYEPALIEIERVRTEMVWLPG